MSKAPPNQPGNNAPGSQADGGGGPQAPAQVPSQLAQFEIVRRLGAGGMAEVFLAKKRGAEGTFKVVVE